MRYRIFTNDRCTDHGTPMYSALKDVEASSPEIALKKGQLSAAFDAPRVAPAVAIHWPESAQSDDEKNWLRKHVGPNL